VGCGCGRWVRTNRAGAAASEGVIGGREEADKSSGAAKTSRELEEVAGVGRKRGTGEFLEEFKGMVALMALVKGEDQRRGSRWSVSEAWA
jgi:hypothetical protein